MALRNDFATGFGAALAIAAWLAAVDAVSAEVPLDGFYPLVGMGLTDEFVFDDLLGQSPIPSDGVGGNLLGAGGTPFYDVALLDTGAGLSLVTNSAFDRFGLGESGQGGGADGFRGTQTVPIGGATGTLTAEINDPLGLYASGLQDRTGAGAALAMDNALLQGQTNTSTLTFPADSALPNVIGLPFASQYATRIRNDQPQVFRLEGRTVRAPAIEFHPLGSGGGDIARKAQLSLDPGAAFTTAPGYFQNIFNIIDDLPVHEDPQLPTGMGGGIASGGLFLDAYANNDGQTLGSPSAPVGFFFDTGASVTVLSEASAAILGFDVVTDEPDFTISILGSGGLLGDVPGFVLDQITLPALGGPITATNVPVLVLDVTDVSDPGNIVPGILGTNLLAGRNVAIDPNPSTGAGGESAGVYISDPVTAANDWSAAGAGGDWAAASSWAGASAPDLLSLATVRNATAGVDQQADVTGAAEAWNLVVGGAGAGDEMVIRIASGGSLTTFSGSTIDAGGVIELAGGVLDTQFASVRGGAITGVGEVRLGSGPIESQIEVLSGTIAPGDASSGSTGTIEIDGRLLLSDESTVLLDLVGDGSHDRLTATGSAAIAGTLEVSLAGGFQPFEGDEFELIGYQGGVGGAFETVLLPAGIDWDLRYGPDALVLTALASDLAGDVNLDGVVDAADYTVWRDRYGVAYDDDDYLQWAANYGQTAAALFAVPEPSVASLALVAIAAAARRRG
ncbi:MAG: retropepsin-like aspartic protease [Planctomycetota bacterium]